jgi:Protein of unknown function (DUF3606)
MAGAITTKMPALRNQIAMSEELEVKYWTKHLGVSRDELQRAVNKVGNSAAAVRKELGRIRDDEGLQ